MPICFSRFRRNYAPAFVGLAALMASASFSLADITIKAEPAEGEKVADIAKIAAKIDSTDGIDKVEFRVDDELRLTDTSTPYVYDWDTIADKEGKHAVTITAFDSNGSTKRFTLNLEIDNELGLGVEVLAAKAKEALGEKKYDAAILYGRRALKAEPGNILGSRAIASVYGTRRDWGKAIATLDKAMGLDASAAALGELASYRIQRALEPENAANFFAELSAGNELRHKAADLAVQEIKKTSAGNPEAIGDALVMAGRIREAIAEYGKVALRMDAPTSAINRLALAHNLSDHPQEALGLLRLLVRVKKDDAATRAILGLSYLRLMQFADAKQAVQADLVDQKPASLIVAAFADNALGKSKAASVLAKDAIALAPGTAEAYYALALSAPDLKDQERAINRAVGYNTFQSGPYLDYAARLIFSKRTDRYEQVLNVTDLVLKNEPDNLNAKLIQAQLYLFLKKVPDAETVLAQIGRMRGAIANPDVQLILASYWAVKENSSQVNTALAEARRLDAARFDQRSPTLPLELLLRLNRKMFYRSGYFLMPSTLFPKD